MVVAPPAPIALTSGDPAGIGPDITLAAWHRRERERLPPFAFIGDSAVLAARAGQLGLPTPVIAVASLAETAGVFARGLPCLGIPEVPAATTATAVVPGRPDPAHAPAIIAAIDRAVALSLTGEAAAMVTNPVAKHVLAAAGFAHPGHTEYLAWRCAAAGQPATPVMMLAAPQLRVVPVTVHLALREAIARLDTARIVTTARIAARALARDFGVARPRLAVTGLNPHAGEAGLMGREEDAIIAPAIALLLAEGVLATGPHPADTLFHAAARQGYDAVIAMYHDQALIPLKTLAFDEGVNVTLGLPLVRTSPDHGTAFAIAGTGAARADSLCHALRMAADIAVRRAAFDRRGGPAGA